MASIPASTAQTDSDAALAALKAADNANFIVDADKQITDAIALGKSEISATTFGDCDILDIFNYYANLGYHIEFPDLIQGQKFQPADLFGEFWIEFWNNTLIPHNQMNPVRIIIRWDLI